MKKLDPELISRRQAIGTACASALLAFLGINAIRRPAFAAEEPVSAETQFAVLVDLPKCVGCRACVGACKEINNLPRHFSDFVAGSRLRDNIPPEEIASENPVLAYDTYTVVQYRRIAETGTEADWLFIKRQCMHCLSPACVAACPVAALQKDPRGPVTYDGTRCIGCRYCMMACPYGVPTYEWQKPVPYIRKCTFCAPVILAEDQEVGDKSLLSEARRRFDAKQRRPACVKECPTGTLKFGQRDELLAEARARIAAEPKKYINQIFGEVEAGGTSWLYIAPVEFAKLGLPGNLGTTPYNEYTEAALGTVAPMIVGGGLALAGFLWLKDRREHIAEAEQNGGASSAGGKR